MQADESGEIVQARRTDFRVYGEKKELVLEGKGVRWEHMQCVWWGGYDAKGTGPGVGVESGLMKQFTEVSGIRHSNGEQPVGMTSATARAADSGHACQDVLSRSAVLIDALHRACSVPPGHEGQ